ncbi:hypothetical protein [Curtobacterium ammoniigenes]|uniref:hypothetical protein n=1 Tax=Curtobacterium ammoniigenes TaxID=395387 RepID=UPI00082F4E36|nr:hypothetical protein [Curtobacterium ammoniigenes]
MTENSVLVIARTLDCVRSLVEGGVPARRAWELGFEIVGDVRRSTSLAAGGPIADVLEAPTPAASAVATHRRTARSSEQVRVAAAWIGVGAVWRLAERTGAPVGPSLSAIAGALRDTADADRACAVALAGPAASARVVLVLPLIGVLLGALTGADSIRVLVSTPLGWCCVIAAAGLVLAGHQWSVRMLHRGSPEPGISGILLEAWGIAVSGGGSLRDAETAVADLFAGQAAQAVVASEAAEQYRLIERARDLAARAGVPVGPLLRRSAIDLRRDAAAQYRIAAERLGVRLVMPLGVCVLPAFVLVGVVPMLAGIFSSTPPLLP